MLVVMQSMIYVQKRHTTGYIPYTSLESLLEFESISFTRNNYLVVQILPQIIEFMSCAATRWAKVVGSWVLMCTVRVLVWARAVTNVAQDITSLCWLIPLQCIVNSFTKVSVILLWKPPAPDSQLKFSLNLCVEGTVIFPVVYCGRKIVATKVYSFST